MSNEQPERQRADAAGTDAAQTEPRLDGQRQDQAGDRDDQPTRPDTDAGATQPAETSSAARPPGAGDDVADSPGAALFSAEHAETLRGQWAAVQTAFVDDPPAAVERADHLVVETIQILSTSFAKERSRLEEQLGRGESVSTEDLRVALQLYRSFFERLLRI
jgi:hypothetical protein